MILTHAARATRITRLHRHGNRLLIVPLDHTVAAGPIVPDGSTLDRLVAEVIEGGADAIVLHKGSIRAVDPRRLASVSLIVHLNGSTRHAPDPDAKTLVCTVEEALRWGADAVSFHLNIGCLDEQDQLRQLGTVADACDRWNLPLLVMAYPRGPLVRDPHDPQLVEHAVTVAADLGADLVKTLQVPSEAMARIVDRAQVPVIVAGGPPRPREQVLADVRSAIDAGVHGLAMGRCLFNAAQPRQLTEDIAALVHHTSNQGGNHVQDLLA